MATCRAPDAGFGKWGRETVSECGGRVRPGSAAVLVRGVCPRSAAVLVRGVCGWVPDWRGGLAARLYQMREAEVVCGNGMVRVGTETLPFERLARLAFTERLSLSSTGCREG